jgi:hypothetical protein
MSTVCGSTAATWGSLAEQDIMLRHGRSGMGQHRIQCAHDVLSALTRPPLNRALGEYSDIDALDLWQDIMTQWKTEAKEQRFHGGA